MKREQAIDLINSSLREGAELRTVVARDCSAAIFEAANVITRCLRARGKLLFFGNGGSAADAQHLAAEFVGRFVRERAGLPAIALTTDSSILTAVGTTMGLTEFSRGQIQALGPARGRCDRHQHQWQLTECARGRQSGQKRELKIIGLTGKDGGASRQEADLP